ncbi:hypothetical protein BJX64DRAFT_292938 [Aspergillus heterothallicus]
MSARLFTPPSLAVLGINCRGSSDYSFVGTPSTSQVVPLIKEIPDESWWDDGAPNWYVELLSASPQPSPTLRSKHSIIMDATNIEPHAPTTTATLPPSQLVTFKPIIIPQVARSSQSEIITPFLRAYSPTLESHNITQCEFLVFIDGLNGAWIAHPVLQAAGIAGSVMSMIHPVEIAGMVIEGVAEAASEGSSYLRTRRYLNSANENMFRPRGLNVRVCKFDEMLDIVGVSRMRVRGRLDSQKKHKKWSGNERMTYEDLDRLISEASCPVVDRIHPRLQTLKLLDDHVAPLQRIELAMETTQANILGRWNASFAAKEEKKRTAELEKKHEEAWKRRVQKYEEALDEAGGKDKRIAKLMERIEKAEAGRDENGKEAARKIDRLRAKLEEAEQEKQKKAKEKLRSANRHLEKLEKREMEDSMNMKWLVISQFVQENEAVSEQ